MNSTHPTQNNPPSVEAPFEKKKSAFLLKTIAPIIALCFGFIYPILAYKSRNAVLQDLAIVVVPISIGYGFYGTANLAGNTAIKAINKQTKKS